MRALPLLLAVLATPAAAWAQAEIVVNEDELDFQESEELLSPSEAWQQPGFRVQLSVGYGGLIGVDGPPDGALLGVEVGVGVRLDPSWSLMAAIRYEGGFDPLGGFAFSTSFEPTWHLWEGLSVSIGAGIAGMIDTGPHPDPNGGDADSIPASLTYQEAEQLVGSCYGYGTTATARVAYWVPMGHNSAFGVALRAGGQWIGCEDATGRVEADTADAIVRRQWWSHFVWGVQGGFQWR